jgi:hypothetical protein
MMVNTSNWDKFSKRIVLGLIMSALVAAVFLLIGIYIVGAEEAQRTNRAMPLVSSAALSTWRG